MCVLNYKYTIYCVGTSITHVDECPFWILNRIYPPKAAKSTLSVAIAPTVGVDIHGGFKMLGPCFTLHTCIKLIRQEKYK